MADHRVPDVHNPSEESAWEGGGRAGLENYRGGRYAENNEEQLMPSDEDIEDRRRPAPGHSAITAGSMGPSTRDDGAVAGAPESGPIKGIPDAKR